MMPKSDTIAAILRISPSADPAFLAEFSNRELHEYLSRLRQLDRRTGADGHMRQTPLELVAGIAPQHAG